MAANAGQNRGKGIELKESEPEHPSCSGSLRCSAKQKAPARENRGRSGTGACTCTSEPEVPPTSGSLRCSAKRKSPCPRNRGQSGDGCRHLPFFNFSTPSEPEVPPTSGSLRCSAKRKSPRPRKSRAVRGPGALPLVNPWYRFGAGLLWACRRRKWWNQDRAAWSAARQR